MGQKRDAKSGGFEDSVIEIRRVTRVVAGGKRFSFRASVVLGDRNGRVGVGVGKGLDVAGAVAKGKRAAEKEMFLVPLKDGRTIPYDIECKYAASRIKLKPVEAGHGLIAGGSCRRVLELAGIKDISAKILSRTTNKLTNARVTIKALKSLKSPKQKKVSDHYSAAKIDPPASPEEIFADIKE